MAGKNDWSRFAIDCEHWVITTATAHRVLEKLVAEGAPVCRRRLVDEYDEPNVGVALNLLEKGNWVKKTPASADVDELMMSWNATEDGKRYLETIKKESERINTLSSRWLLRCRVREKDVDRVAGELREVARRIAANLPAQPLCARDLLLLHADRRDTKEGIRALLRSAAKEIDAKKQCPLVSILCREVLDKVSQEFYESMPPPDAARVPLSIFLDTNVLTRLLCPDVHRFGGIVDTLNSISRRRAVTLYVTQYTLAETRRLLLGGEWSVQALMSTHQRRKDREQVQADAMGNPFVLQYVRQFGGQLPYSSYADRHYRYILDCLGTRRRLPELAHEVQLVRRDRETDLDLSGLSTTDYPLKEWPTHDETFGWLRDTKSTIVAEHDTALLHAAIWHRQSDPNSHWVIWTTDGSLIQFEREKLQLRNREKRLVRNTRMMDALWATPSELENIQDDVLRTLTTLTAWAASTDESLARIDSGLALLRGQAWTVEVLREAFGDPYGALLAAFGQDEIGHMAASPVAARAAVAEPPRSEMGVPLTAKAPPGWPERPESPFPSPAPVPRKESGRYVLVMPSGGGDYIDLSADLATYSATHGPMPTTIGSQTVIGTEFGSQMRYPEIQLGVHTGAHFDLPWALAKVPQGLRRKDKRPGQSAQAGKVLHHSMLSPQEHTAVVVDMRCKARALHGMIEEVPKGSREWALSVEGMRNLKKVLKELWISKEDIQARIYTENGMLSLRDRWLVLHTGWTELFRPVWPDVSAAGFECWFAWTLHPYIDEQCAEWLMEQRIYGVATDTAMIDCPAYELPHLLSIAGPLAAASEFLRECQKGNNRGPVLPEHEPAHVRLLLACRPMLESLIIPSDLLENAVPQYNERGVYAGLLFTIGLGMHQMTDGALAKVFLRVGNDKIGNSD